MTVFKSLIFGLVSFHWTDSRCTVGICICHFLFAAGRNVPSFTYSYSLLFFIISGRTTSRSLSPFQLKSHHHIGRLITTNFDFIVPIQLVPTKDNSFTFSNRESKPTSHAAITTHLICIRRKTHSTHAYQYPAAHGNPFQNEY